MNFFDCYAHLGLVSSDSITLLRTIQEAKRAEVSYILTVSNSPAEFEKVYSMVEGFPLVLHAVGFAPSEANNLPYNWQHQLQNAADKKDVIAIGAIGLDYAHKALNKKAQTKLFVEQLDFARKLNKPVIIYNRNAGSDVKAILLENAPKAGVIFHCYSETSEYARAMLKEANFPVYFSFAGNITFRQSRNLHRTVLDIPLDKILVETASPFLSPSIFNGSPNVPANIFATVEFISEMLDMDFEACAAQIYRNSLNAFRLS